MGVLNLTGATSFKRTLAAFLVGLMLAGPAAALPQGGEVVSGKASISQVNASTLQIRQFSANVIINWKGFSVGANALVRFFQPAAHGGFRGRRPRPIRGGRCVGEPADGPRRPSALLSREQ